MNSETKQRIDQIKNGEVPEGYRYSRAGLCPNDWDSVHLYQIAEPIVEQAGDGTYETLSISAGIGFVNQAKKFGKELSGKQYEKYTVLNRGDFSYNKGNSKSYPQGCIYRLNDRKTAAVPNVFESFRVKRDDSDYYEQLFISGYLNKQLSKKINHGVRDNGLLNLTEKDFYSCYIPHPSVTEQQKIAEILMQCDKLIELYQREVDELQKFKKTCLHKMFPKKGENVPECRFKGFTDVWEQRKLGELAVFNPKEEIPDVFEYVDLESVVGTEMLSHRTEEKATAPSRAQRLAHTGDLFYQTVRPYQKNNYLFEKPDKHYVFSTGYAQLRPSIDGYFLLSLVQNGQFVKTVLDNCTGTSYPAINANDLAEIEAFSPKDEQEHHQIGTYFRNLDNLITLHQRKAEEMKKQKKSLMQLLLTGIVRVKL